MWVCGCCCSVGWFYGLGCCLPVMLLFSSGTQEREGREGICLIPHTTRVFEGGV